MPRDAVISSGGGHHYGIEHFIPSYMLDDIKKKKKADRNRAIINILSLSV